MVGDECSSCDAVVYVTDNSGYGKEGMWLEVAISLSRYQGNPIKLRKSHAQAATPTLYGKGHRDGCVDVVSFEFKECIDIMRAAITASYDRAFAKRKLEHKCYHRCGERSDGGGVPEIDVTGE
jgi:hypothetical protein